MIIEIIAECGINHRGDMKLAREMIDIAKSIGIKIVKFQLYDVDTLFPDKQVIAQDKNWYEEVKKTQLTKEQVFELANYCKQLQIEFMASCFDLERLGWLEEVRVKRHKVATRMNRNMELITAMVETGKEVLLSDSTTRFISYFPDFKFLYCIPEYPTPLSKLQLQYVDFKHEYTGFSSHYPGIEPALFAMARGARIIEVHFCLSRQVIDNPDITSSIEPKELKELVRIARVFEKML